MSRPVSTVVPLPLSVVESNLRDLSSWPAFLGGVEWIERTAYEQYVFGVREGRRIHEIPVAAHWAMRDHRVTWKELSGRPWRGELNLVALNGRRTRVQLSLDAQPRSWSASISQLLGAPGHDLDADLGRLTDRLAALPQPLNPQRLAPTRPMARRLAQPQPAPEERPAPAPGLASSVTPPAGSGR
jgi:hypothetical protein